MWGALWEGYETMTGWSVRTGNQVGQREKIYAMIRAKPKAVYEIARECWDSTDKTINGIKPPTIRRCLQELRDHTPPLAIKDWTTAKWAGFAIK